MRAAALCALLAHASAADVAGVPRSLAKAYAGADGKFACLDGRGAPLPLAAVNDDFCDCADGSDEPGTSACAGGRFFCAQKGFRGKFVPAALVGDGVCDCCDGADEAAAAAAGSRPLGAAPCRDTCAADGAGWRAAQAAAIERAAAGAAARAARVAAHAAAAAARGGAAAAARAARDAKAGVKAAADAAEAAARAAAEAAAAAAPPAPPAPRGDAAAEAALGLGGAPREALLALLIAHARATGTGAALVERVKGMLAEGKVAGAWRGGGGGGGGDSPGEW